MTSLYAGVMSGTSLDGADAVVVELAPRSARTLGFASVAFTSDLRARLLALSEPRSDSLDIAGEATVALADVYAEAVRSALAQAGMGRDRIAAIGCHGQTVRHRPERGFTMQLNDPGRLAELTGISVVADFRRRDIAAGGQGAPLVPVFHDAVFRHASRSRAIVNIGGISNVTFLDASGSVTGFDCGPGNVLLDAWANRHLGTAFDSDGRWAAQGRVQPELLDRGLSDPFFALPPPKSTGRERFHREWIEALRPAGIRPEDVQATLVELTARTIVDAIERHGRGTAEIYLCGGGVRNRALASRLASLADGRPVGPTDLLGIPAGQVEAAAFAWLAMKCVLREPVDLGRVTGARGPRILGAIYPA